MAIALSGTSAYYSRTANFPSIATYSACFWLMRTGGTGTRPLLYRNNSADSQFQGLYINISDLLYFDTQGASNSGSSLALNTWYHVAVTRSGTLFTIYLNGVSDFTVTTSNSITTQANFFVGGHGGGDSAHRLAALKYWDGAALGAAAIQQEMWRYLPQRTLNLYAWWPFLSVADDEIDFGGNARTLTVNGTPTTIDGPPISWGARPLQLFLPAPPGGQLSARRLGLTRFNRPVEVGREGVRIF